MQTPSHLSECTNVERIEDGCVVLKVDLINLYSEMISTGLQDIPGFITNRYNKGKIHQVDNLFPITTLEIKLKELFNAVVDESKKRGLTINSNKTEHVVVCKSGTQVASYVSGTCGQLEVV